MYKEYNILIPQNIAPANTTFLFSSKVAEKFLVNANLVKLRLLNRLTWRDKNNTNDIDYNNKIIFDEQLCKSLFATVIMFYNYVVNLQR